MQIERVEKAAVCEVTRRRGIQRISFYGDSMTRSMVQSLWMLLGASRSHAFACPREREEGCSQTFDCGGRHILTVHQIREGDTAHVRDNLTNIAASLASADVIVLNFGSHYGPVSHNSSYGEAYRAYTTDMFALASLARAALEAPRRPFHPTKQIVFRSTPPGHPRCDEFGDLTPSSPESQQSSVRAWLSCPECVDLYGWPLLPMFDRVARDILEPTGVHFLDVTTMSNQRPDAHTAWRHDNGRLPPDCMHYTLPGVPDHWNALLISALERCVAPLPITPIRPVSNLKMYHS